LNAYCIFKRALYIRLEHQITAGFFSNKKKIPQQRGFAVMWHQSSLYDRLIQCLAQWPLVWTMTSRCQHLTSTIKMMAGLKEMKLHTSWGVWYCWSSL